MCGCRLHSPHLLHDRHGLGRLLARHDRADGIRSRTQRIVHQVGITVRRAGLGMAKQCSDNWQGEACRDEQGGIGVPQIVKAAIYLPGRLCRRRFVIQASGERYGPLLVLNLGAWRSRAGA